MERKRNRKVNTYFSHFIPPSKSVSSSTCVHLFASPSSCSHSPGSLHSHFRSPLPKTSCFSPLIALTHTHARTHTFLYSSLLLKSSLSTSPLCPYLHFSLSPSHTHALSLSPSHLSPPPVLSIQIYSSYPFYTPFLSFPLPFLSSHSPSLLFFSLLSVSSP